LIEKNKKLHKWKILCSNLIHYKPVIIKAENSDKALRIFTTMIKEQRTIVDNTDLYHLDIIKTEDESY